MPAKAASTAGAAASLLNSEGLRAIQAALAESTRVSEDIGAINDGRRQAEKADCRDTSLCSIARDVTIAQWSSSSSACVAELAGGAVSGRAGPENGRCRCKSLVHCPMCMEGADHPVVVMKCL